MQNKLNLQKNALIERIPELKYCFVDIYHPGLKTHIPFLPIRCFRDFDLYHEKALLQDTSCSLGIGAHAKRITFLSSGSTNAVRAKHSFSSEGLNIFAENSCRGFEKFLLRHNLSANVFVISLVPPPSVWANSSLSTMIKMFEDGGFCVKWDEFEKALEGIPKGSNVIIFGTTFHHLMLIEQFKHKSKKQIFEKNRILKKLNVSIIDTGGTKGKTQFFTLEETKRILREFYLSSRGLVSSRGLTAGSSNNELDPAVKPRDDMLAWDDIKPRDDTKPQADINFFSEYGMCELGSQAWSLNADHDGTFVANDTLLPFAIDLLKCRILPETKSGFLGFVDFVNRESYSAIITEDLGCVLSQNKRIFKLLGRAPDSSVKGCSLNIKNFLFTNKTLENVVSLNSVVEPRKLRRPYSHDKVISWDNNKLLDNHLSSWDKYSLSDFKKSFSSLNRLKLGTQKWFPRSSRGMAAKIQGSRAVPARAGEKYSNIGVTLKNKNILLICAANTPISFVYPLIYCALNDAQKFTLKIPSIRPNDPQSENIRMQIVELFQYFSGLFPNTEFLLSTSKSIENNFQHFDAVFVFGTDETLQIIQSQCPPKTQFFGFGDIKNAFVVNNKIHTTKFLAEICSVWNGRGCLTPVCLFINSKKNDKYIFSFFKSLTFVMNKRLKSLKNFTFHDHNTFYIRSQLKKMGFETVGMDKNKNSLKNRSRILRSKFVTVVDLSHLSTKIFNQISLDFSFGGSGFVYILPKEMKNHYKTLSFKKIFPCYWH